MENLHEDLLAAWLTLTSVVNNERIVSKMPFNEAHVCNLLYRQQLQDPEVYLTATELCAQTRMLKSQMNKVLTALEKRGLIERFPSPEDRRKAFIRLRADNLAEYEEEHARSLALIDHAIQRLGVEKAAETANLLRRIAGFVDEHLSTGER